MDGTERARRRFPRTRQTRAGAARGRTWRWAGARWLLASGLLAGALVLAGCDDDDCVNCPLDTTPPAVPTGVFSVTGDGLVTVYWNDLYYEREEDLLGYYVYRSLEGPDGPFDLIDENENGIIDPGESFVAWDENFDAQSGLHWFDDRTVINAVTYDYAVASIDANDNESLLSFEEVFDTPRPEGFAVELTDFLTAPATSGFDFSLLAGGRVDPAAHGPTDIYVEFVDVLGEPVPYVQSARLNVVRLQDYGTIDLAAVDWAPEDGYSSTGRAELIAGHSYIVEIDEGPNILHYAKFAVTQVNPVARSVVIDWAYQLLDGSPELKMPAPRLTSGESEPIRF